MSETSQARLAIIESIGREIAKAHADDVDEQARFPIEAITALKEVGAFAWPVPVEYGGKGISPYEIAKQCTALAQHCASTAAIFAMHHTQILSVVHHAHDNSALHEYMRKVVAENRLIASVTSEVGPGGHMRSSQCAVEMVDGKFTLVKKSTTLSYGRYADDLMITARKDASAAAGDQVLVIAQQGQFELSDEGDWDTTGMRGTCSPSFTVEAHGEAWQVIPVPFAEIAAHTMVPTSHIFWSASWFGGVSHAVGKARELLRLKAKANPGTVPMGAMRVVELDAAMQTMEFEVFGMAREYADALQEGNHALLSSLSFAKRINALKLTCSQSAIKIVTDAIACIGIQAYKNGGPFSLGRQLRDVHSAVHQVHNDRIQQTNASILLIHKGK